MFRGGAEVDALVHPHVAEDRMHPGAEERDDGRIVDREGEHAGARRGGHLAGLPVAQQRGERVRLLLERLDLGQELVPRLSNTLVRS